MSLKACVWAGRFAPDFAGFPDPREPIPEDAVAAVFARFADRDATGELVPPLRPGWWPNGRRKVIGYIGGEYAIYHRAGFVEVVFGGVEPRIDGFLAALHRELGCRLLDANNLEWITDRYLELADRRGAS